MTASSIRPDLTIRPAEAEDAPLILTLIRGLAEYEKLAHELVTTEEDLRETLFGPRPSAEVVIARVKDEAVGFAIFFHNYSTFLGRPGLYLEDLFVRPEHRGRGYGASLLRYLAALAKARRCGRFEWSVLDWNEPAIRFYRRLGAVSMDGWTVFRVTGAALDALASEPW